ncbi:DUF4846 domain-containing protein [Fusobacterium sp.]|uniref:DUF4846 domain-containing protein n=1 Tax=Fusobacterium sp. TaxID=68766 RepID=UPI0029007519|nr:DUF4846 domain-containing protein [Fusobacterium sp.]MDU1911794.1 DUF4846 domain-containing protein [Fusobacterium sp.]
MKKVMIFIFFTILCTMLFSENLINKNAKTIESRFLTPNGYEREIYSQNSFGTYLRNLKLKEMGAPVLLYDGRKKFIESHISVIDMPILPQDLIQCADAVIKLRAEYLYNKKDYDKISFNLTNGMEVPFSKFVKGERVKVNGNKTTWVKGNYKTGYGREVFEEYLKFIYTYAGTLSLSKEMKKANIKDIEIGDVFIQGGSPGHVVIVVDIAVNKETGQKIMILAQSYMPSQELHILKSISFISPWYKIEDAKLITPEWLFEKGSLKKW